MILTIRTDSPEAEVGVFQPDGAQVTYRMWHADRQLAKELLATIRGQLTNASADWHAVTGVVIFAGPGSFTGLRIGITVANSLAYAQHVPIVAAKGEDWLQQGLERLRHNQNDQLALPHYGGEAHITVPRK